MATTDRGTLVDANVLLDVITEDPTWSAWSAEQLASARDNGRLLINPLVYAEVTYAYATVADLEAALPAGLHREALPYDAAFAAGKAFVSYRRRGGTRRSPLPDFYIGAHAAVRDHRLLTRDGARYRTYFPSVEMVAPD